MGKAILGKRLATFVKGSVATIGRGKASDLINNHTFSGLLGWLMWGGGAYHVPGRISIEDDGDDGLGLELPGLRARGTNHHRRSGIEGQRGAEH